MSDGRHPYQVIERPPMPLPELQAVVVRAYTLPTPPLTEGFDEPIPDGGQFSPVFQWLALTAASLELLHLGLSLAVS